MSNVSRVAIVTGGASGIGRAMARYFVEQQYGHVAVLDVNEKSGKEVVSELADANKSAGAASSVRFLSCDVSSWASQAAAFREVFDSCGRRIDVVMANAGISENGESPLVTEAMRESADEPSEPSMRTLNVNLVGTIFSESPSRPSVRGTGSSGAVRGLFTGLSVAFQRCWARPAYRIPCSYSAVHR